MSHFTKPPKDGLVGLLQNWKQDLSAGFSVFLLALPLSLGIAKASEFPPVMGLLTAIIGGIIGSLLSGSPLSIKGPAAGLIVVVAGAVTDFGGGEAGWHYALGAMLVAALVQIGFGLARWGKMVDYFPLTAVHGMLAAIGLIIIAKQIPVLLDINPALTKGKGPLELFTAIPEFVLSPDLRASAIGITCLVIMLLWPRSKNPVIRKIPAPLVVLAIAIPAELAMDFKHTEPEYALLHVGDLWESLDFNVYFNGLERPTIFMKYVLMFALIGSLESLLTIKAVDLSDPYKRKSSANRDLLAIGVGNALSAILGGLPMISEVARSTSNVSFGARTRWSGFFHGLLLLVFVIAATPLLELIPNTALAAMLITVGIRLSHPKEFIGMYRLGPEALAVFITTIFVTLAEDLLLGIFAGMALKILIHTTKGTPISSFFKSQADVSFDGNRYLVSVSQCAVFTNFPALKRKLESIPPGFAITIDLSDTTLVDTHTMESLHHFCEDYNAYGSGKSLIAGLDNHRSRGNHRFATRSK
jgi:MFS superfamily sulfate permease-like transporter